MTKTTITTTSANQSRFDRALADYLSCRAALDAEQDLDSSSELRLMDALGAAERRLFATPAQSVSDLRTLAEIAWQDRDSLPLTHHLTAIFDALRQLTGNVPSRTFNAAGWLDWYESIGGGWFDRDGEVRLISPVCGSDNIESALWVLKTRGGQDAVKAVIQARQGGMHIPLPNWAELRSRYETQAARMAENEAHPYRGTIDDPDCAKAEAKTAEIVDAYDDAANALLRFPAPDAAALRFKLALLTNERFTCGHHPCAAEFAKLVQADADRLLVEA